MKSLVDNTRGSGRATFLGTVRHQWSPRVNFEVCFTFAESSNTTQLKHLSPQATTPLLSQPFLALKANYNDDDNGLSIQTRLAPALMRLRGILTPACSVTYSRRLFSHSGTQGVISLDTMSDKPTLGLSLTIPSAFDFDAHFKTEAGSLFEQESPESAPVQHGLAKGTSYYSVGLFFAGPVSGLRAEWGVQLSRLALQLRLGSTLNVLGLDYWFTGSWDNPANGSCVEATLNASTRGLSLFLR